MLSLSRTTACQAGRRFFWGFAAGRSPSSGFSAAWTILAIRLIDSFPFNRGFDRLFWCRAKVEVELFSWLKKTVRGERLKGTVDRDGKAVATLFEMHPLRFDWGLSDFLTPGQKSENFLNSTEAMLDIARRSVRKVSLIAKFDEFLAVLLLMIRREFIKDEWIPLNSDEKLASGTNNIGNDNVPETSVVRILFPGLTTGLLSKHHAHKSKDLGFGAMLRKVQCPLARIGKIY
jgi:hypothetical protein